MPRPVFVYGTVKSNDIGVPGAVITTSLGVTGHTLPSGAYLMCVPAGVHDVAIYAEGYPPTRMADVNFPSGGFVRLDFEI